MKKILVIAATLLLTATAFAQDGKSIYNKYSDAKDVSGVYISPAMFRLIGKIPDMEIADEDINLTSIIMSLTGLYIIDSENVSINENIKRDAEKFVKDGKYELLMEVKESSEVTHIYITGKNDNVSSFVLISYEPDECTFICIDGQISREKLEKIIAENL